MKAVLKGVWLSAWGLLLAACGLIILSNVAVSQTLLSSAHLQKVIDKANLYDYIRHDVIAPQVISAASDTEYGALVDTKSVNNALKEAFPDQTLKQDLRPVSDALVAWLDSKAETVDFTIDTKASMERLGTTLTDQLTSRVMKQPTCSFMNSYRDLVTGVCKAPFVTEGEVHKTIAETIDKNDMIQAGTFRSEQITLPGSVTGPAQKLPDYINILYTASLVATAVAIIVLIWLLIKYRSLGLMTIGGAIFLTGIIALIMTTLSPNTTSLGAYQALVDGMIGGIMDAITPYLLWLIGGGLVVLAAGILWWYLKRRRTHTATHTESLHI